MEHFMKFIFTMFLCVPLWIVCFPRFSTCSWLAVFGLDYVYFKSSCTCSQWRFMEPYLFTQWWTQSCAIVAFCYCRAIYKLFCSYYAYTYL